MVSFVTYLLGFKLSMCPIGDVARDIDMDMTLNRRFGYKKVVKHLTEVGACERVFNVVDIAYQGYKQTRL
jgi:hypothetical protein